MHTTDQARTPISYAALRGFVASAFEWAGLCAADAGTGADVLAMTDAWGVFTHGTKLLRDYLKRLQAGGLRANGQPRVVAEGPAWGTVDGDSSLAMVTSTLAMRVAMTKARQCGIGCVGVRNSCHFGAAGYYTWLAAREDLIGLGMANDIPSVAAPGSRSGVTGSNPISYAVPAGRHRPILLDMSIATVAGGKVYGARSRGERIPDTWLIGADGKPTTDPSGYPQVGALQPAAGHKGYGLAVLIETLAGILSGAAVTWGVKSWLWDEMSLPTYHGAFFMAIDVEAMAQGGLFSRRVEALVDEIHRAPRADGVPRLYVPGEKEWEKYEAALRGGLTFPPDVLASLQESAALAGLDFERELLHPQFEASGNAAGNN